MPACGVDAPVDDGGGVACVIEWAQADGVGQQRGGIVAAGGGQGEVFAQHRPRVGAGNAGGQGFADVGQVRELCCAEPGFGCGAQGVVVHVGGRGDAGEGVAGVAVGAGGRDLSAVAGQGFGQDVDGGVGMGGLGAQDAVRIGFGGGEVNVVFGAAAGQ